MILSSRVKAVKESVTLKLNELAVARAERGEQVFNLTAGQLPFRPSQEFIDQINSEMKFLKSYQYSPVPGFPDLREKFMQYIEKKRAVSLDRKKYSCVVNNGAKHSVYNALGTLLDPTDEVILLAPYWVSYPEMVRFWGGESIVVGSTVHNGFTPEINDIRKAISFKTKVIIVNSPNNPAGIHYSEKWMKEFAEILKENPSINVISDEIYYELTYYDPRPTYFYQFAPELLERTIIIDGISKSFACTGLRVGFCIGPTDFTKALSKLQAQTTSGANSLVQKALINYPFEKLDEFLVPIKNHLRNNADFIRDKFRELDLSLSWYQTSSAFYFLLDFSTLPLFAKFKGKDMGTDSDYDYAAEITSDILENIGVAMVPGGDFGRPNTARMSLVLEEGPFQEAITRLANYLKT